MIFGPGDLAGRYYFFRWNGSSWVKKDLFGFTVDHGHSVQVVDFDQDGHLDIFVAEMRLNGGNSDAKMWMLFGDGTGNFNRKELSSGIGNHESKVGDLDG